MPTEAPLLIRCPVDGWVLHEPLQELFPTTITSINSVISDMEAEETLKHVSILDLKHRISALRGGAPVGGFRLIYKGQKLADTKSLHSLLQEHASDTAGEESSPALLYLLDNSLLGASHTSGSSSSKSSPGCYASPGGAILKPQSPLYYSHRKMHSLSPSPSPSLSPRAGALVKPDERSLAAAADWLASDQAVLAPSGRDCDEHYLLVATSLLHLSQVQRRSNGAFSMRSLSSRNSPVASPTGSTAAPAAAAAAPAAPAAPAVPAVPAAAAPGERVPEQRWIHVTLLLRFALAVIILGIDAPLSMQAVYALVGILYYLHEVRKMRNAALQQAAAAAIAAGARPPPQTAPVIPAPPQGRLGRLIAYWEDIYNEGFPVPQSPGIFLDLFSVVMGLFASLYPHWDPRPVTPIVRGEVPAALPPAPPVPGPGPGEEG